MATAKAAEAGAEAVDCPSCVPGSRAGVAVWVPHFFCSLSISNTAWLSSGSLPLRPLRAGNYLPSNHLLFENPRDRCLFDLCGPKSTLLSLFTNHVDAAGTGFDLVKGTRPSV